MNIFISMFCDSHNDIFTSGLSFIEIKNYLIQLGNVEAVTAALWTTELLLNPMEVLTGLLERFFSFNGVKLDIAVEDAGFVREEDIGALCSLPLNYIGLTWNYNNKLAGGALDNGRLTQTGKKLITEAQKHRIYIDTAHLNKQSFWDVIEFSDKPLINSHTCISAVCPHPRNLDDSQIKAIIEREGYIGIAFVGDFLNETGQCGSDDVIRHIDYFVQKFGVDNIGIGTDFFGTENTPADIKDYKNLHILVEKMAALGYNKEAIDKITRNNYLKTFNYRR